MQTLLVLGRHTPNVKENLDPLTGQFEIAYAHDFVEARAMLATADIIFDCGGISSDLAAILKGAPRLRWIHSRYAGVEGVVNVLRSSEVTLTNGRGVYAEALGEFAIAAMFYFAKNFPRLQREKETRTWEEFEMEMIAGKSAAIIGYGEIGKATARRAAALGMQVHALRRRPELNSDAFIAQSYSAHELDEVCAKADYIVLAAALTPATRHMIGARQFEVMQGHAVLINVGRGALIDESKLIPALAENKIRGAALDVFETEPLPAHHPLFALPNVLISPHCADRVPGWLDKADRFFVENALRFLRNETLLNVVDKAAGY